MHHPAFLSSPPRRPPRARPGRGCGRGRGDGGGGGVAGNAILGAFRCRSPPSHPTFTPDKPLQTAPFLIARYDDARAKPTHARALRRRRRSLARLIARGGDMRARVASMMQSRASSRASSRAPVSRACVTRTRVIPNPRFPLVVPPVIPNVRARRLRRRRRRRRRRHTRARRLDGAMARVIACHCARL